MKNAFEIFFRSEEGREYLRERVREVEEMKKGKDPYDKKKG
jgi:hypothetical protein